MVSGAADLARRRLYAASTAGASSLFTLPTDDGDFVAHVAAGHCLVTQRARMGLSVRPARLDGRIRWAFGRTAS
ncbi:hypothetical protein ASD08_36835 [Streptomyces sp. Root369]|nr:hypothetical protein ASD08_36835 [Streptomyces sp. Root369]